MNKAADFLEYKLMLAILLLYIFKVNLFKNGTFRYSSLFDARKWKQRYWRLLSDIKALHRHQSEPEPSEESENTIRRFMMRLPDEILRADDPLAALLEMHQKEDPPEADGLFW